MSVPRKAMAASAALLSALLLSPSSVEAQTTPLSGAQALDSDAASYARAYGVPVDEAKRRMLLEATSGEEIGQLELELASTLSGAYFDNGKDFALVVRVLGTTKPADRVLTITTGRPDLGATQLQLP